MPDTPFIHNFAMEYLQLYQNPDTKQFEVEDAFGDRCFALGFKMDAGESFKRAYPEYDVFYNAAEFKRMIHLVDDSMLLGNAIFSQWRSITHWDYFSDLLSTENRAWFIVAFARLAELTAPLSEASERIILPQDVLPPVFCGELQRFQLISDNYGFGLPPEPDEEVEQHITVCRDGRVWFSGYNYGTGHPYVRNRRKQFKIAPEKAAILCDMFQTYFSENRESWLVLDAGTWELKMTSSEKEVFYFHGSMYAELTVDGKELSDLMREYLNIDNLWGFAEKAPEEEYLFCRVIFGEGQKGYYYIADDETIHAGDFVVVPAGIANRLEVARVVSARWYRESATPLDVDETKHILRRCVAEDIALLWK